MASKIQLATPAFINMVLFHSRGSVVCHIFCSVRYYWKILPYLNSSWRELSNAYPHWWFRTHITDHLMKKCHFRKDISLRSQGKFNKSWRIFTFGPMQFTTKRVAWWCLCTSMGIYFFPSMLRGQNSRHTYQRLVLNSSEETMDLATTSYKELLQHNAQYKT